MKRTDYIDKPALGYWSEFNGVEIKEIGNGVNDYIICVSGAWGKRESKAVHKVTIHYSPTGCAYIRIYGRRLYLDEAIKIQ